MDKILIEKIKEYKEKENNELERIKTEYEIKIKSFKEKYKELEESEFVFLENEFIKCKDKMQLEYNKKLNNLEAKLKSLQERLIKKEEELDKRGKIIEERRQFLAIQWNKLNDEEKNLDERKILMHDEKIKTFDSIDFQANKTNKEFNDLENQDFNKLKYEIEKIKLEKNDYEMKYKEAQKLLDKLYKINEMNENEAKIDKNEKNNLTDFTDSIDSDTTQIFFSKINEIENQLNLRLDNDEIIKKNDSDDDDINDLIRHAKLKLKLKYHSEKKKAQYDIINHCDASDSNSQSDDCFSENYSNKNDLLNDFISNVDLNEEKKNIIECLNMEKDSTYLANEVLDKYKHFLFNKKTRLNILFTKINNEEQDIANLPKSNEKTIKQQILTEKKNYLEKEMTDIEQLDLDIKTSKRLIKQKKHQLKLLEKRFLENMSEFNSSDNSDDEIVDESVIKMMKSIDEFQPITTNDLSFKSNNITLLINKLANSHSEKLNFGKLEQILKKIPKLNEKLDAKFRNMNDSFIKSREKTSGLFNEIDYKFNNYLKDDKESQNYFQLIGESISVESENKFSDKLNRKSLFYNTNEWENSPFYHKLTFKSGTHKMLEEKWNTYVGNKIRLSDSDINKNNSLSKIPLKNSSGYFSNNKSRLKISLPASTQKRIVQHKEWLQNFKKVENSNFFQTSSSSHEK
jgi:hypothetical protein